MTQTSMHHYPFTFVKDYKADELLRASFNALTQRTYGFDFENWFQLGYWPDSYKPYSLVDHNQVIANVSVNTIDFLIHGKNYKTLQIGTVMTDKAYRKQGLSAALMHEIFKDFEGQYDFIYLFANDSVLDFYPKFGFVKAEEIQHTKTIHNPSIETTVRQLDMSNNEDVALLVDLLNAKTPNAAIVMQNNLGLYMFYLTSFMSECVYYIEDLNTIAIAEIEGDTLHLMDYFSLEAHTPEAVAHHLMNQDLMTLRLGFTPLCTDGYEANILAAEDTTLFIKGDQVIGNSMFPVLSHA